MANGQQYYVANDCLIDFIEKDPKFVPKASASNISRLSGVNSAKTVSKFMKKERVTRAIAFLIFKLCVKYEYKTSFDDSVELIQN
jgi:hypothetical protein